MDSDLDAIFDTVLANVDAAVGRAVQAVERADPSRAAVFADRLAARLAGAQTVASTLRAKATVRRDESG